MDKNIMKFSVVCDNEEFGGLLDMSISIRRDSTADDLLEVFERMAVALTYSPKSLKSAYENRLGILKLDDMIRERLAT